MVIFLYLAALLTVFVLVNMLLHREVRREREADQRETAATTRENPGAGSPGAPASGE